MFIGGPLGGGCSRRLRLARDKVDNSFDARTAALGSILGNTKCLNAASRRFGLSWCKDEARRIATNIAKLPDQE
jgi:hypothetical protein